MRMMRRAPPLWVLLDILMLWVLALVSVPMEKRGVSYKFLGLPSGSVLFEASIPLDPKQDYWRHFDFSRSEWILQQNISPRGRENFLCDECAEFLPEDVAKPSAMIVGLPKAMRAKIHGTFFEACQQGDCAPTIYIDQQGNVFTTSKGPDQ